MLRRCTYFLFMLFSFLLINQGFSFGQDKVAIIETKAEKTLKQMCDYLSNAGQFTFTANTTFDKPMGTVQNIEYGETVNVSVIRPNRLYASINGDVSKQNFWYNGKTIAILDTELEIYATADAPDKIDGALDFVQQRYGTNAPLSDFIRSDPYASLTRNTKYGYYMGVHSIDGIKCHHLAFEQENLNWQVWIEDGTMPVPRKLVIIYKEVEGIPRYAALLTDWNLSPYLPESVFTFNAPVGAEEREFLPEVKKAPGKID